MRGVAHLMRHQQRQCGAHEQGGEKHQHEDKGAGGETVGLYGCQRAHGVEQLQ